MVLVRTYYPCHYCRHTSFLFLHRAVNLRGACTLLLSPLTSQVGVEVLELVEVVFHFCLSGGRGSGWRLHAPTASVASLLLTFYLSVWCTL